MKRTFYGSEVTTTMAQIAQDNLKKYLAWVPEAKQAEATEVTGRMTPAEVEDAFGKRLAFGTAGLRGKMGHGSVSRFRTF